MKMSIYVYQWSINKLVMARTIKYILHLKHETENAQKVILDHKTEFLIREYSQSFPCFIKSNIVNTLHTLTSHIHAQFSKHVPTKRNDMRCVNEIASTMQSIPRYNPPTLQQQKCPMHFPIFSHPKSRRHQVQVFTQEREKCW